MPRGSKPGERRGGRRRGTPNKATAERELIAKRELEARELAVQEAEGVIAAARRSGRKLAREVLDDLMHLGVGIASFYQMAPPGQPANVHADWDKFWRAAEFARVCAADLAKYQSPTFKAIVVAPPPPSPTDPERKRFSLTIFEGLGVAPVLAPPVSAKRAA